MLSVSIITPAYNEAENIGNMFESIGKQCLSEVRIREIIVVANGCTDSTVDIVERYQAKDSRIKLMIFRKRMGMARAINAFFNKAKSEILVLVNADTILKPDCLERLVEPFSDGLVGVTAPRMIPLNTKDNLAGYFSQLWWKIFHLVAIDNFRGGEILAFRKLVKKIPEDLGSVENYITDRILSQGFKAQYIPKAEAHNMGPQTVNEVIAMRRRHNCHTYRIIDYGLLKYFPKTMDNWKVLKFFVKEVKWGSFRDVSYALASVFLEALTRTLGRYDYYLAKRDYKLWPRIASTKKLIKEKTSGEG